jgi:F-type H+-transporting ATPase subunit gamma
MKEALAQVKATVEQGYEVGIVAVGKKPRDFFQKRGYTIDEEFLAVNDIPSAADADAITKMIKTAYVTGKYDEVRIVYAEFRSAMSQIPKTVKVLPIETPESETADGLDYIFEPSPDIVLSQILPLYLANQVFSALTEAKAGEHGARMTAMSAASDNAAALVARLDLEYNRARQAAITNEITEICAGANALNG